MFRQDLDKFIDGQPLQSCSMEFQLEVARLFMIPLAERSIEAKHSLVKMSLFRSGLKGSPLQISFSNRLPELRRRLADRPQDIQPLLCSFDDARNRKLAVQQLNLQDHPLLQHVRGDSDRNLSHVLRRVLYRVDVESQHYSFAKAIAEHQHKTAVAVRQAESAMRGA